MVSEIAETSKNATLARVRKRGLKRTSDKISSHPYISLFEAQQLKVLHVYCRISTSVLTFLPICDFVVFTKSLVAIGLVPPKRQAAACHCLGPFHTVDHVFQTRQSRPPSLDPACLELCLLSELRLQTLSCRTPVASFQLSHLEHTASFPLACWRHWTFEDYRTRLWNRDLFLDVGSRKTVVTRTDPHFVFRGLG